MSKNIINYGQKIIGADSRSGYAIKFYDDGYGPLFIHRDSLGITAIVRAQTLEDAYGICEDEFFPEADETIEEIVKEYGFRREHVKIIHPLKDGEIDLSVEKDATLADYEAAVGRLREGQFVRWETRETPDPEAWAENGLFQEAFGFRPNGPRQGDTQNHGIYAKDLHADLIEKLTPELIEQLEIRVFIREFEEDEIAFVPSLPLL